MKTFLLFNNHTVEKIHKLPILLEQCITVDPDFDQLRDHVKILDRYYITTRYPSGFGPGEEYTEEEARHALRLAKEIISFIEKHIDLAALNESKSKKETIEHISVAEDKT